MNKLLPALLVLLLAFSSCKKEQPAIPNLTTTTTTTTGTTGQAPAQVTISSISPSSGSVGTVVTISGTNFGTSATVLFNGVASTVQSITATEIKVVAPVATSGNVTVTVGSQSITGQALTTITGPVFTYAIPTVTGILPATGSSGAVVTISGTNFGTSTLWVKVLFNGVGATVQSVTSTEIKVVAPVATSGNVTVTVGSQSITGPAFTYISPLTSPYVNGDVRLTTQAEVDAFVALNKGKQLQINGGLSISGNDITSVAGLSNITSVSGTLFISACPLLSDVSFLNNITSAGSVSFQNLVVTAITMDKLTGTTGNILLSSCKNLNNASFKSLTSITGNSILGGLRISSCGQLSNVDFSSLSLATSTLLISGTALSDLSGFSALQTAGSLTISGNPALTNFHGLEQLTTLTLPAIYQLLGGTSINGINITGNAKLTSLAGLQNLTSVPIASITGNANLNDFCPLKALISILSTSPAYSYRSPTTITDVYRTVYVPALTLTSNGNYAATPDALAAVALCK
ncbi:IPT/TIG domain-containing protein [Mucilaginibacter arboris]|uniref:IPT/TIG domain-containing protein n=1 Tax=Mucilaginibacter arboris TaxID=2682090 RepID=A0A7K1SWB1_9SPHI|nr:IPT/TIG domain-containing protein [Mucilaginibacter arboris]MVN21605.1 hypothetical protein [Mucilaginibacter arboris]